MVRRGWYSSVQRIKQNDKVILYNNKEVLDNEVDVIRYMKDHFTEMASLSYPHRNPTDSTLCVIKAIQIAV